MHFLEFPIFLLALMSCSRTTSASRVPLSRRNLDRGGAPAIEGTSSSGGFWFCDFAVGASSNLTMLVDIGSGDIIVNPGLYKPSGSAKPLNATSANTYGTTSSDGTGNRLVNGSLYTEQVSFGSLTTTQIIGSATGIPQIPADGIVGFSGPMFWQFPDNSTSFMQSLCTQGKVSECRFGLAVENENTGSLIMGQLDTDMYHGNLIVGPIYLTGWATMMDLAINGTVVARDFTVEIASGIAIIGGPIEDVKSIFQATGIQGVLYNTSSGPQLVGYFSCDSPPTVGFSFPSQTNASTATETTSKNSALFDIPASTWAAGNNGDNNCTAILGGHDTAVFPGLWTVGQPFFQGRYIDHNLADGTIGIALLKAATTNNTTPTSTASLRSTVTTSGAESKNGVVRWTTLGFVIVIVSCVL